jgi:uncharacterized protein YukE
MNNREINIENLTEYQVEMLDIMWGMESHSEFESWYELLDKEDQNMADLLVRMIVIETVEQEAIARKDPYKEANAVLSKFRLN